jgi:hypothetical protein
MKKLAALLAMVALLSVAPMAFAADSNMPATSPRVSSHGSSGASNTPGSEDDTTRPGAQGLNSGDMRQPGPYMWQDGALHNVPGLQDPKIKVN